MFIPASCCAVSPGVCGTTPNIEVFPNISPKSLILRYKSRIKKKFYK